MSIEEATQVQRFDAALEQVIAHLVMTHDDIGERLDMLDVVVERLYEGVELAGEDGGSVTH